MPTDFKGERKLNDGVAIAGSIGVLQGGQVPERCANGALAGACFQEPRSGKEVAWAVSITASAALLLKF